MAFTSSSLAGLTTTQIQAIGNLKSLTPIVLDLQDNGINTVSILEGTNFDLANTGQVVKTGWITGGDGLLVRDLNGDGTITRDFTPVENVVQINTKALFDKNLEAGKHFVFNVACGRTTELNTLWDLVKTATNANVNPIYGPNRPGDIFFSLADVSYAMEKLNYLPNTDLKAAIEQAVEDYKARYAFEL
jgi:nucleoside-diphosphate-sugar epimerase